ncbi:hypothetical protein QBC34DRAFT_486914 [Podospora aff. communis PSN243]|uniref:DUF7779 domain-containing protein n=1 Tax=Podospora aff. communis PSN243 TaxID=3040156 RepID=A0AAV9GFF5_9PEZI|nr:hypothetical protein QBC34DRAFT_486914 [Podospora aff. communis PSN243]
MTSDPGTCMVTRPSRYLMDAHPTPALGIERLPDVDKTFRIRGVPLQWDAERLESFLAEQDGSADPVIVSLVPEIHGGTSTGTLMFQGASSLPRALQTNSRWRIPLPRSIGPPARPQYLIVDSDFHGITILFAPPPDDHKVDVVALSGLGGHAFGSFNERGGTYMWLRDSLPDDLTREDTGRPMARVMTYGYESAVAESKNIQNLEDLATSFHHSLLALVGGSAMKPMILVGHSLGGLIVKQTMIMLAKSKSEDDQRLIQAVYGIVFFGVPHDGMDISSLIPMVGDGPNRFLVESTSRINSQILSIQQREFHDALGKEGDSEIVCFYETLESPTAQGKDGDWAMTGPAAVLVTKASATHCRPWEDGAEHICAVARTHSNMVKFGPQDHEYDKVRDTLRGLARRALTKHRRSRASNATFLVPYVQNQDFVGRAEILKDLKQYLGIGQRQSMQGSRVALYGLGGVGALGLTCHSKTQIALAYVYWLQDECPEVSIFWVHASSTERFRQAYLSIAKECSISGHDDPKADVLPLVKSWLESKDRGRWLIVIDNADDAQLFSQPGNLSKWIPECAHGSVLVTTRNKVAGSRITRGRCLIEVGKMDEAESQQLLREKLEAQNLDPDDLLTLSSRLEHLPLALVQAAAFIQEMSIGVGEYLRLLEKSDHHLVDLLSEEFETVGRDSGTPHAVVETWILSLEQIQQQDAFAGELLSLMSVFDPQAIPQKFLSDYSEQKQGQKPEREIQVIKALGILKAFSFIAEDKNQNLDIHRLVQLVTRKWLGKKETMRRFVEQALLVVSRNYPYGKHETAGICSAYLPHASAVLKFEGTGSRDESLARALLLHRAAGFFDYQGQWKDAEGFLTQATRTRKGLLGEEHPDTLTSMANLASTYWNQGRWKEAEELGVQVMETRKRVLREEHPDTLTSMANLASTYWNQGRWKEAEELEVQVMETFKRVMANLASTYWNQGRWKEAEELEVQVMETFKRVLGEEHPATLTSIANLASTHWNQGRWKEAEELEVQVMETFKRVLGEEHPDTLTSMANLAHFWKSQGRLDEALDLMGRSIELQQQILGPDHPHTVSNFSTLRRWRALAN